MADVPKCGEPRFLAAEEGILDLGRTPRSPKNPTRREQQLSEATTTPARPKATPITTQQKTAARNQKAADRASAIARRSQAGQTAAAHSLRDAHFGTSTAPITCLMT